MALYYLQLYENTMKGTTADDDSTDEHQHGSPAHHEQLDPARSAITNGHEEASQ